MLHLPRSVMNSVMTGSIVLVFLWNLDCRYSPVLPLTPIDDRQITTSLGQAQSGKPRRLDWSQSTRWTRRRGPGTQAPERGMLRRQEFVS
jgi:hypothetical protein